MDEPLEVYWQPGCTSCLRAKEFLASRGIEFVSINVLESPAAFEELRRLGARTVPVVRRGGAHIFAQDIDELARFVGVSVERERLPVETLIARLSRLLEVAASCAAAMPARHLRDQIPERPRRYADIAWHIAMVVQGLLDSVRGGELAYEYYERTSPEDQIDPARLSQALLDARGALSAWSADARQSPPRELSTYYGRRPFDEVLERTTWHVAQHCRQLDFLVRYVGAVAPDALRTEDLVGLPVPAGVWDPEIRFG